MKKRLLFIIIIYLSITNFCVAQAKIEKYCQVEVSYGKVYMDFGKSYINFKDSTEIKNLLEIKYCKNIVDVLDYMSNQGWSLISCVNNNNAGIIGYFKKAFDKSEFTISNNSVFINKKT
jgi:hypothetical protein